MLVNNCETRQMQYVKAGSPIYIRTAVGKRLNKYL